MIEKEAIKEMKKIERIIKKLIRANYDIAIIEGNNLVLTSQFLADIRNDRMDNVDQGLKENGLDEDEVIYSFEV